MGAIWKSRLRGIISIIGPTATGKTYLAHLVAEYLASSGYSYCLVSVDSGAVYKELDIGTAKPSLWERERYKYLMLDVVLPSERYSSLKYVEDLSVFLEHLHENCVLVFVGGTPLYFYITMGEHPVVPVKPDPLLRAYLRDLSARFGSKFVWQILADRDPFSAEKIHPSDEKRIIRALEIYLSTGKYRHMAEERIRLFEGVRELRFVLLPSRELLRARIKERMEKMFMLGWVEEVQRLMDRWGDKSPWTDVLGYREIVEGLLENKDIHEIKRNVFKATWSLARRQYNWFKKDRKGIVLHGVGDEFAEEVLGRVREFASTLG
jgi:tRNA dimethylallyltransferase